MSTVYSYCFCTSMGTEVGTLIEVKYRACVQSGQVKIHILYKLCARAQSEVNWRVRREQTATNVCDHRKHTLFKILSVLASKNGKNSSIMNLGKLIKASDEARFSHKASKS